VKENLIVLKIFQTLDNHQLIWHESITTSFAGILSQGLRIAPPEAPLVSCSFFSINKIILLKNQILVWLYVW
jgi:hypothetical protein